MNKKRIIENMLMELGISVGHKGFVYNVEAIAAYKPGMKIVSEVYGAIAEAHGTKISNIERGIRHALESATLASKFEKKTNKEIIAHLALLVERSIEDEKDRVDIDLI